MEDREDLFAENKVLGSESGSEILCLFLCGNDLVAPHH